MELKNFFAQDDAGNILSGAACYLYQRGTESLIKGLQGPNGVALDNPFITDQQGLIQFAAPNGLYDLRVVTESRDYRIRVQCHDVAEAVVMAPWKRVPLLDAITTVGQMLSSQEVSIWEFASFITSKPNLADRSTWDWTPAINAALDSINATGGGGLYFPPMVYFVAGRISKTSAAGFRGNIKIRGSGMTFSVLKFGYIAKAEGGNEGALINFAGQSGTNFIDGLSIEDIGIDYTLQLNKGGQINSLGKTHPSPAIRGAAAISVTYGANVSIRRVAINDVYGNGITVTRSSFTTVEQCFLLDCGAGNIVSGPTGWDNNGDGIVFFFSFGNVAKNNVVLNRRKFKVSYTEGMSRDVLGLPCGRTGIEFEYPIDRDGGTPKDPPPYMNAFLTAGVLNDLDIASQRRSIISENFIFGYTKGIHIETGVIPQITLNTIMGCHIGAMMSVEYGLVTKNVFHDLGVGMAPQVGYNYYYCGVAVSQYGAEESKPVTVEGNIFEGDGKGVVYGKNNVHVLGNTFKNNGHSLAEIVIGASKIVFSGNFSLMPVGGSHIYAQTSVGLTASDNHFHCKGGLSYLNVRTTGLTLVGNELLNTCIDTAINSNGRGQDVSQNDFYFDEGFAVPWVINSEGGIDQDFTKNNFYFNSLTEVGILLASGNYRINLSSNKFYGKGDAKQLGINVKNNSGGLVLEDNKFIGSPTANSALVNIDWSSNGLTLKRNETLGASSIVLSKGTGKISGPAYVEGNNGSIDMGAEPNTVTNLTTGARRYSRGEKLAYILPTAGGAEGIVCVADGTPGTWKTYGSISA